MGHPKEFLKVMHCTMFGASPLVTKWLYEQGIDPDTQYLPDVKFFKKAVSILVGLFNYRPAITQE